MTPENFCYWLQGYFEIGQHANKNQELNKNQTQEINNHLSLVFNKITPNITGGHNMRNEVTWLNHASC